VIIPCYNHAHYLPDALDSLLAQTFADWEAIVVDDGSLDNTRGVALDYVSLDSRFRYIHQDNRGLSSARNLGILAARGQHFTFLDADDALEPGYMMACLSALHRNPDVAAVYTGYSYMDEHGTVLSIAHLEVLAGTALRVRLLRGGFFPPVTVMVRQSAIAATGHFDENLTSTEDWDLWLRLTEHHMMAGIGGALARYRVYTNSMSTNAERMHRNRLAVLSRIYGPPDGLSCRWPKEKRQAYAHAFLAAALGFVAQGEIDTAMAMLLCAAETWPQLLTLPDTHYELALWDQPRGYRGQAEKLDLSRNADLVLSALDELFAKASSSVSRVRAAAYGHAHLALAMLADQALQWDLARRHMLCALLRYPRLALDRRVLRRMAKLLLGQRLTGWVRHRLKTNPGAKEEQPCVSCS